MNKRDLRLELCRRALALAEHPKVSITTGLYAHVNWSWDYVPEHADLEADQ